MIGQILIYLLFVTALCSAVAYFISFKGNLKFTKIGRYLFYSLVGIVLVISGLHLINIFSHNFQYTYVWSYSSKQLPPFLLMASFYAGQEGSFLLWTLMVSIIGIFLLPYTKRHGYESVVMFLYSIILSFLGLMLIAKSPFQYVWNSFPELKAGFMPPDGRGLNPVLENIWITIHPPILFSGYAAMTVPYVFAIAGLLKKDFKNWITIAKPWTLLAAALLGTGLILGGFWAYETLGWGGFWGWDPVENSSLLPWLVSIALIHTFSVQKRTGGLVKTNFVIAIFSFIFVLYGTFLTRSGVLGETSVHSFVDPGQFIYILLLVFLLLFLASGIIILLVRSKDLIVEKINFNISSREFAISLGAITILAITFVVFIGTSLPIFQTLAGMEKSSVESSFYNKLNLPLGIILLLLNSITVYLTWKSSSWKNVLKRSGVSTILAFSATIILIIFGMREIKFILLSLFAFYSLVINADFAFRSAMKFPAKIGTYISHFGVSVFFLGVIASGGYSITQTLIFKQGQTLSAFGYNLTLTGKEQIQKDMKDREKYKYNFKVENASGTSYVSPVVYWSDFNNRTSPFFEPGIAWLAVKDIYVSPKSISMENQYPTATLSKGSSVTFPFDSSVKMTFLAFDMSKSSMGDNAENMLFGAVVNLNIDNKESTDTIYANFNMGNGECDPIWYDIPGKTYQIGFTRFIKNEEMLSQSKVEFALLQSKDQLADSNELFSVDVSSKPFMNLVWIGAIFMVIGIIIPLASKKRNE
ncbi:MAG: cytochrome c-type biogenesis CcmF C-terminal domain-containing protein [FCB group bacterium]|jgi:cytochrome c-type biogenesis protein CcmF